jgi:PTS system cellobiose-specific IIB component
MPQQYSIEQISGNLNKILQDIEQGEPIQIMQQGQQIAVILSATEYERLLQEKSSFSLSLKEFRKELIEEGIEIDPDEVWGDLRPQSPGREITQAGKAIAN